MSEPGGWYWKLIEEALAEIDAADSHRPRVHFVILGAGMAGLAAAWELRKRGHTVEIIEGSDRVGGRVFTHRFKNGSYGERGAMRLPLAHDYTHHYIREAGIPSEDLRRFWNSQGNGFLDVRGQTVRESEYLDLLPAFPGLTDEEKAILRQGEDGGPAGPGGLLGWAMGPLFRKMEPKYAALLAGDFRDPELEELDRQSWREYLEQQTSLSPDGQAFLGATLSLAAVWEWSMAAILRDEISQMHPQGEGYTGVLCEIAGGLDRLPRELAARLPPDTIRFRTRVLDIRLDGAEGGSLLLEDTAAGTRRELGFERLLCTLPFPVLRDLPLETFSEAKLHAVRNLRYASSTKVLFNYDERWWERDLDLRGGRSVSDRPDGTVRIPRQTYYPSDSVPQPCAPDVLPAGVLVRRAEGEPFYNLFSVHVGEAPFGRERLATASTRDDLASQPGTLLAAYTVNDGARELCESGDLCKERVLTAIEKIHRNPDARHKLKEHLCWCWDNNPWSQGAFAITPPEDLTHYLQAAKKNEGSVYFAGEHVSIAPGWIQGALESSLREVARMLRET